MGDTRRDPTPAEVRVAVVDDDDINRAGLAALLARHPRIRVAFSRSHAEALSEDAPWQSTDVALIDAADPRREDDQFPGVAVVEHLRAARGRAVAVVVVTGHYFNDAVRRRMREAGADFFYHRGDLADAAALYEAVLRPSRPVPGPEDPEEEFRHGVTRHTRVNQAVSHALANDLPARLAEHANPRARAWERLRRGFNQIARLNVITTDGREPDRNQPTPSLPQISRFLAWATRINPRGERDGKRGPS